MATGVTLNADWLRTQAIGTLHQLQADLTTFTGANGGVVELAGIGRPVMVGYVVDPAKTDPPDTAFFPDGSHLETQTSTMLQSIKTLLAGSSASGGGASGGSAAWLPKILTDLIADLTQAIAQMKDTEALNSLAGTVFANVVTDLGIISSGSGAGGGSGTGAGTGAGTTTGTATTA